MRFKKERHELVFIYLGSSRIFGQALNTLLMNEIIFLVIIIVIIIVIIVTIIIVIIIIIIIIIIINIDSGSIYKYNGSSPCNL